MQSDSPTDRAPEPQSGSGIPPLGVATLAKASLADGSTGAEPSNHARKSVLEKTTAHAQPVDRRDAPTQHILPNAPAPKPKTRKRVAKPTLTLTPNPELVAIAKEHFANTRHGNITTWLNRALLRALRKDARRIRAAGIKIPEWLFLK